MDYIHRALIWLVLVVVSGIASADQPSTWYHNGNYDYQTKEAACNASWAQASVTSHKASDSWVQDAPVLQPDNFNAKCMAHCTDASLCGSYAGAGSFQFGSANRTCPGGNSFLPSSLSGSPPSYAQCGGTAAPSCTAGNVVSSGLYDMGTNPEKPQSGATCNGGCLVKMMGSFPEARGLVGGVYHYYGKGEMTQIGGTCTVGPTSPASPIANATLPPNSCGSGQVLGQFNGKDLCLTAGGEPVPPSAPKEETTTKTPPVTNPDGSTTTTETVTHGNGSSTTTTTKTNPDGSTEKKVEEKPAPDEDPDKEFCKKNPDAPMCVKSSFGGGCGGFQCKGDPIQCAIAQEQHRRNCTMFDTSTALSDLGNQVANGNDPNASQHPANVANRSVINVAGSINTSKQYSGTCPVDRSVTVMGQTIAIPLSTLCPYLEMFGSMMIALAMLGAARTVGVF